MTRFCSATVYTNDIWRGSGCSRKGIVEREGKWWCRTHDPVAVAQRRAESAAKYDAQWAELHAAQKRHKDIEDAKNAVINAAREARRKVRVDGWFCNAPVEDLFDAIERLDVLTLDPASGIETRRAETSEAQAPSRSDESPAARSAETPSKGGHHE